MALSDPLGIFGINRARHSARRFRKVFTNNDATQSITKTSKATERIDYIGASLASGFYAEASRFTVRQRLTQSHSAQCISANFF